MKKWISLLIAVMMLMGCHTAQSPKLEIEGIVPIQYEQLIQKLNSNVTFLLYIGRPDCGDCQEFYPYLQEYIQQHEHSGVYYLNVKEFRDQANSSEASQEEKEFYQNLYQELEFDWTPTIHVVSNGKMLKTYQYLDEDYLQIKDREKQLEKKQEFLDEFQQFMDDYFKEE